MQKQNIACTALGGVGGAAQGAGIVRQQVLSCRRQAAEIRTSSSPSSSSSSSSSFSSPAALGTAPLASSRVPFNDCSALNMPTTLLRNPGVDDTSLLSRSRDFNFGQACASASTSSNDLIWLLARSKVCSVGQADRCCNPPRILHRHMNASI